MVEFLPGLSREASGLTETQFAIYVAERYVIIGLYVFLFALVAFNSWRILVRQRRYKNLPLLAFYIFTFLSISCILTYIFIDWTEHNIKFYYLADVYIAARLSVGLIQCWMVLEIALRER